MSLVIHTAPDEDQELRSFDQLQELEEKVSSRGSTYLQVSRIGKTTPCLAKKRYWEQQVMSV